MVDMMIDRNLAASAYGATSKMTEVRAPVQNNAGQGVKFSDLIEDAAESALDTMKASEVMSAKAITGEADMTKVVEAVTAAEVTLQTAVALRDRMITAYQEIMRMPI